MISFDEILEKNIKTGWYQARTLSIIGLQEFCAGLEYLFMSILMTILKEEWNLSQNQVALLSSIFLFGIVLGNFLCAFLADIIGRQITFIIFSGLSVILIFYTSFCDSYKEMIILRFLYGLTFGTLNPLGYVYVTEITEAKYRGRFSYALTLIYILGKIYFVILCFIFLDDYTSGNWRGLIRFNGIPITIAFILSILYLTETIRSHLSKGEYEIALNLIDQQITINGNTDLLLCDSEKNGLISWSKQQKVELQQEEINIYGILSQEYRKVTILLWILYILTNFQEMTIFLLLPFLLQNNHSGFLPMLALYIIEFIFGSILYNIIDDAKYGGRIKIIAYSAITLTFSNAILYLFRDKYLYLALFLTKIATRGLFATICIICCESYPVKIRSQGQGIAQAVGKIAVLPSPYLLIPLYFIDPYLPFAVLFILAIVILAIDFFFKQDKTQQHLEILKNE
ncbi:unnamed protein product [Paramecium octaurelia]|uniref:Major facilitator superfamily (MFS) profile domain-containing protein n=1 Tax=Paramecium octaurelia TaxID=43137 RepID=A0A8S1W527_PAROT|nr:unnamed protein product [Paramecium octaurelia]